MLKIVFLSLLLVSFVANAEYELESILHVQEDIIKDDFVDSSAEEIEAESLEGLNASSGSIDDVLRLTPFATTARGPRSSGEAPQVRGLDDNKIFVKIDGSRQNFQSGHSSMVAMDLENLKRVDIYKSSSEISNFGSIGGGVNFVTKDAKDILIKGKKSGAEFKFQHNSANFENIYNGKYAYKEKNNSGYFSFTNSKAEDLSLSNGETLGHSSYIDNAFLFKHQINRFKFKFEHFERQDAAPLDPTLNPPDSIVSLFSDNTTRRNNVSLSYHGKEKLNLLSYINQYESIKERKDNSLKERRDIETIGFKVSKKIKQWSFGAEGYGDHLTSDLNGKSINSYPEAKGENFSIYGERVFRPQASLKIVPGLRHNSFHLTSDGEMEKKSGEALSKNLKIVKTVGASQFLATYSEGFNAPRVTEVYPAGLHSRGDDFIIRDNFFIPNEELKAERSANIEVGWKYARSVFSSDDFVEFEISAYENDIENYITLERIDRSIIDEEDGTTQFINIPKAKLWGTEISVRYLLNSVDMRLSYSQVRGKNKEENLYLEDLPADQYNLDLKYYLDKYDLTLGYLTHLALEQNRVNPETIQRTDRSDGYLLHSISLSKKFDDVNFDFRIDNLTNTKYRKHASHLYEAGRDIKLALKYKINTI